MSFRIGSSVAALVLSLTLVGSAKALTMVPDPVLLDPTTGSIGNITLVGTSTGLPSGGTQLLGLTGASDISLIFQAIFWVELAGVGWSWIGAGTLRAHFQS